MLSRIPNMSPHHHCRRSFDVGFFLYFYLLDERLDERFDLLDERFDLPDERLDERFDLLDERLDERFDLLDERFDLMNKKNNYLMLCDVIVSIALRRFPCYRTRLCHEMCQ